MYDIIVTLLDEVDKINLAGSLLKIDELDESANDKYLEEVAEALDTDVDGISKMKLFDISILKNGVEVQPNGKVKVSIDLAGEGFKDPQIVHFGNKVEKLDSKLVGDTVYFDTTGFSVYAVVEPNGDDYARMTLEFYSLGSKIATMYVKNGDDEAALEDIIYDPGAGTIPTGQVFAGWILDKQNYTTADIDNAMTIDEVRTWAKSQSITEGAKHRFDAAICRLYNITYKDTEENNSAIVGLKTVVVKAENYGTDTVDTTINMAYTPADDVHNFEGWFLDADSVSKVTSPVPANRLYNNNDPITIKGDITLTVNAPAGNWLIFDENGKGGKYNAPQFVKVDEVTAPPCPDADMKRNGYTFGGWYDTKANADAHGADPTVTTGKITFGSELTAKTTVYASWIPNTTAPYTVILWKQNLARTGYDLAASTVTEGTVGQNIPYAIRDNQDEDYVRLGSTDYHYKGFCAKEPAAQVVIRPEGDSVLNLYYDRIEYNVRFYLYRSNGNNYQYAQNSAGGNNVWGVVDWWENTSLNNMPTTTYPGGIKSAAVDGHTGYYFVLNGYYGEDISSKWPTYDQITGPANNRQPVSYVMMVGTRMKPNPSSGGDGTVKGVVTTLDEGILGATNNSNGNFLIVRFNSFNNWTYHLYYEPYEGQDLTGKTTREFNGKTYYLDHDVTSRSSNTIPASQNAPEYPGFQTVRGDNNKALYDRVYIDGVYNGTPQANSVSGHEAELNYYYDRLKYRISYMDGTYFKGDGSIIQSRNEELLNESGLIAHEQKIPDSDKNYVPDLPVGEAGYVFAGWYADSGCKVEYTFDTMPIGGIIVYAKWVQVEYRVFMHPNAGTDPNLDWGSDTVNMCFKVDYGGKVSTPTGKREGSGYAFVGWYTDPSLSAESLYKPDMVLNDDTVKTEYHQTEETELDKWGNVESGQEGVNNDKKEGRFWIQRKLDLYAKWRKILEGADGITVEYTADDGQGHVGTGAPEDGSLYPDNADATAQAASKAPSGMTFKYWVIQKWDETNGDFVDTDEDPVLPGKHFVVKADYAHKEPIPELENQYTYTMKLRAEYAAPESGVPTHIWWFDNYSTDGAVRHESSRQDEGISINEAVDIMPARTRAGYKFLGWARVPVKTSESEKGNPPTGKVLELDEDDLYLVYENGKFKLKDGSRPEHDGEVVKQVAADEDTPYHDMYAVWKKDVSLRVQKIDDNKSASTFLDSARFRFMLDSKAIDPDATTGIYNEDDNSWTMKGGEAGLLYNDLSDGTYVLAEIAAPDGYVITEPTTTLYTHGGVIYKKYENEEYSEPLDTDSDGNYLIQIENKPGAELPMTGGHGTMPYTLCGLLMILGSALMYGFSTRRRERRYN